jgi:hypothetical protein
MTRIDHVKTAEGNAGYAMQFRPLTAIKWLMKAQVHATLALVEQQRIANLIALGLLQIASGLNGSYAPVGDGGSFRALYPQGESSPLAPDIAAALGIGVDTDD